MNNAIVPRGSENPRCNERKEYKSFLPNERKYIAFSLQVALENMEVDRWREEYSLTLIAEKLKYYQAFVMRIREKMKTSDVPINEDRCTKEYLDAITLSDLKHGEIQSFAAYRFLYERIFGAVLRPSFPKIFLSVAADPRVETNIRERLAGSISMKVVTAQGWSTTEPTYFPTPQDCFPEIFHRQELSVHG